MPPWQTTLLPHETLSFAGLPVSVHSGPFEQLICPL
jgi:hypothetical protein